MGQLEKKISIVVSVYNEELSLKNFYDTTIPILESCSWDYEVLFVNDGSADGSIALLKDFSKENAKVKVVDFSRNFGHEAAMIAGIDHATGDAIVCMDADLQHPPESIPEIIGKFEEGYDVVSMVRTKNEDAGFLKTITSKAFYKVLNMMSPVKFENNSSDFFAISRNVAEVLRKDYREKIRYLRGYVQSVGFEKTTLEFEARRREAGESKYNIRKLIQFSMNALCSFSDLPLKLGLYSGLFVALCGFILMIYTIVNKVVNGAPAG
ncbi:MAG: glycosyltransferase family 2 protein, partial [Eubacterium sp.]|nr:glycosyltransferase family 2 protein [Eubacterium sp.]